jgi:hypothetical protein
MRIRGPPTFVIQWAHFALPYWSMYPASFLQTQGTKGRCKPEPCCVSLWRSPKRTWHQEPGKAGCNVTGQPAYSLWPCRCRQCSPLKQSYPQTWLQSTTNQEATCTSSSFLRWYFYNNFIRRWIRSAYLHMILSVTLTIPRPTQMNLTCTPS